MRWWIHFGRPTASPSIKAARQIWMNDPFFIGTIECWTSWCSIECGRLMFFIFDGDRSETTEIDGGDDAVVVVVCHHLSIRQYLHFLFPRPRTRCIFFNFFTLVHGHPVWLRVQTSWRTCQEKWATVSNWNWRKMSYGWWLKRATGTMILKRIKLERKKLERWLNDHSTHPIWDTIKRWGKMEKYNNITRTGQRLTKIKIKMRKKRI